jgi:hypothetical protein
VPLFFVFTRRCLASPIFLDISLDISKVRDLRFNKVPNIKPESWGRRSRPYDSENLDWHLIFLQVP